MLPVCLWALPSSLPPFLPAHGVPTRVRLFPAVTLPLRTPHMNSPSDLFKPFCDWTACCTHGRNLMWGLGRYGGSVPRYSQKIGPGKALWKSQELGEGGLFSTGCGVKGSKLFGDIRVGYWFSWDRGSGALGVACNSFVSVV